MKKNILTAILSTHQKIINLFTYENNLRCGIPPHPQAFTKNHKIWLYVLAYGASFLILPFAALAHTPGENGNYGMMGFSSGWMWIWMSFIWIIAVLLIVLLVAVIIKLLKK